MSSMMGYERAKEALTWMLVQVALLTMAPLGHDKSMIMRLCSLLGLGRLKKGVVCKGMGGES